jgi:hypothetical protein
MALVKKTIHLSVDEDDWRNLKAHLAISGSTISEFLVGSIRSGLGAERKTFATGLTVPIEPKSVAAKKEPPKVEGVVPAAQIKPSACVCTHPHGWHRGDKSCLRCNCQSYRPV